jgi:hypothetical protein
MFKFLIIIMCIQFSLLGYAAYLTRNISSYKQQVEAGFMLLIQYPGRDFPDPSSQKLILIFCMNFYKHI